MKSHIGLAAFAAVLSLAACSKETTQAASNTMDSAKKDMHQLGQQVSAQFAELKKATEQKLSGVDETMADLQKKAEAKSAEAGQEMKDLGAQIRAKKDEIAKAMSDLDVSGKTSAAWDTTKKKVDALMVELSQLVERAKEKVK